MTHHINRRALLKGGLGVAATGVVAGFSTSATAAPVPESDAEIYGVPTINPLIEQRADPFITRPVNGMYYFTASVPEYDRLIVRGAPTIAGLATATEAVVWRRPSSGHMGGHIWAPELHRIDGKWYIYFAAGDSDNVFRIRMYVIESALDDPRDPAGWSASRQIVTEWDSFSLDATTFAHRNKRYLVWAQGEPEIAVNSSLYIAQMATPWSLKTKPTRIATPTRSWEIQGFRVNEGAAVIVRNGRVFMTFSASATDARYCMGLLTADADADLLDRASWVKTPDPIFVTNEQTKQYGPGHNSFTVAEDGVTDVLVYHARDYRDITGDPLYDPNRHTRVQKLYWRRDGTPMFGIPVGKGGPIVRLSPADARTAFVRHAESMLYVDADGQALADSQFRFVARSPPGGPRGPPPGGAAPPPGFAGEGTESIQSVDFPDRYVRVVDGAVRLDPVESSVGYAGQASFRRVPRTTGVSIQLVSDSRGYLTHDGGRLIVGPRDGSRTRFLLS
ncbi:family 43 glycosylhydrolase [Micromonospora sp. CPCC 205371]|nr:family 43 glycosylhydrolase [Micromonospora sp. CPCC 205371]